MDSLGQNQLETLEVTKRSILTAVRSSALERIRKQNAALQTQNASLREQIKKLTEENEDLRNENELLSNNNNIMAEEEAQSLRSKTMQLNLQIQEEMLRTEENRLQAENAKYKVEELEAALKRTKSSEMGVDVRIKELKDVQRDLHKLVKVAKENAGSLKISSGSSVTSSGNENGSSPTSQNNVAVDGNLFCTRQLDENGRARVSGASNKRGLRMGLERVGNSLKKLIRTPRKNVLERLDRLQTTVEEDILLQEAQIRMNNHARQSQYELYDSRRRALDAERLLVQERYKNSLLRRGLVAEEERFATKGLDTAEESLD